MPTFHPIKKKSITLSKLCNVIYRSWDHGEVVGEITKQTGSEAQHVGSLFLFMKNHCLKERDLLFNDALYSICILFCDGLLFYSIYL